MANREILKLLAGFRRFQGRYFNSDPSVASLNLGSGQAPKTLVIGCCDSRVDPAILSDAQPGELFVVRNVANLVPPFEEGNGFHGVSAAIEFAVVNLKVSNIVVLGHRQCGGIRALVENSKNRNRGFVDQWMKISAVALTRVKKRYPGADVEVLIRHCEMESILVSIDNLLSFPFVKEAVDEGRLTIMGTYFDLESGNLMTYSPEAGHFALVEL